MTEVLDRLWAAGAIDRQRDDHGPDRWSVIVTVTPNGASEAIEMVRMVDRHAMALGRSLAGNVHLCRATGAA